ncbi:hypothetical protein COU76_05495 [Candidatus Peregrinibacteria bacterium CG10_big_fil_rev_8_21_14_0_10_49_10]|nr:MAG: hypothetical protein COU76_05495 [Candidatus Peregrinibacteria bacterium CG10_big_fil_rev_8_21_14_0_10_49_10]
MRMKNSVSISVGLLTVLVVLGALDALLIENERLLAHRERANTETAGEHTESSTSSATSSQSQATEPQGPDVLKLLAAEGISLTDSTKEHSLIEQVIPADVATIHTFILMKDNDRIGLMAWADSPQVTAYFLGLKEALHSTFSTEMHDLIDEVQEQPGKPPRTLLTFIDPRINEDRVVFVRIRQRLYEFHVAAGKDDVVFELIEALTY